MTPEGRVKNKVKDILKANNIWYFMPAANGYGKVGVPDFICCWNGRFLAIETKAPGKKDALTANQQMQIGLIRHANGWALVVDNEQDLLDFIDTVKEMKCLNRPLKN